MQIILPAIRGIVLIEGVCMVMRGPPSRFSFFVNVLRRLCLFITVTWHVTFLFRVCPRFKLFFVLAPEK